MTVLAATGLLDAPGRRRSPARARCAGDGADTARRRVGRLLRGVHGGRIGFVFQDPGTSLNPLLTLERQITESLETHRNMTRRQARGRALELLEAVGLPDPQTRLHSYPHQLSGGQRQRVMIAIALACDPELLIADEPTTSLDVTTQAQIIELVRDLQRDFGTAVVWISHDLGVIGQVADDVTVLQDGDAVEQAPVARRVRPPAARLHARAAGGPPARRRRRSRHPPPADAPALLDVDGLDVRFPVTTPVGRSTVHAVKDLSFRIRRGTTLGLVGESGSGKSTVAAALTGLVKPDAGTATLDGDRRVRRARLRGEGAAPADQPGVPGSVLVAQPPHPGRARRSTEPLRVHRARRRQAARARRGSPNCSNSSACQRRSPRGIRTSCRAAQRQRVSIARALAGEPDLLILDEVDCVAGCFGAGAGARSARDLQRDLGLTYLFIAPRPRGDPADEPRRAGDAGRRGGRVPARRGVVRRTRARVHPRAAGRGSAGATTGLD